MHRFCRVPGRSSSLGLGKNVEPVFPSQQLFLNAFPVLTTRFQIWIAQDDVTSPSKVQFVQWREWDLQSRETQGHWETTAEDGGHHGPLLEGPDDYVRWYKRGQSHSMLLRVDSDAGTWSMLGVTGEKNTACHLRCSWSYRSGPCLIWREGSSFVTKLPGLLTLVCGVTWHYIAIRWTLEIPYCCCSFVLHKKAKLNASNDRGWIWCLIVAIYVALPEPLTTTDLFNTLKYFV